MIEKNEKLPNIQKFYYLKNCLRNEASRLIETLTVSAANYRTAWETSKARYSNERLTMEELVYAMLNAPAMNKNSPSTLRQLTDTFIISLNSLKALGFNTESWDPILVLLLIDKVDFITKREWQARLTAKTPKWSDLTTFLEQRCQGAQTTEISNKQANQGTAKFSHSKSNQEYSYNKTYTKFSSVAVNKNSYSCVMCKNNHALYRCIRFINLPVNDRINFIKLHKLCNNRFKSDHSTTDCKASSCRTYLKKTYSLSLFHRVSPILVVYTKQE